MQARALTTDELQRIRNHLQTASAHDRCLFEIREFPVREACYTERMAHVRVDGCKIRTDIKNGDHGRVFGDSCRTVTRQDDVDEALLRRER